MVRVKKVIVYILVVAMLVTGGSYSTSYAMSGQGKVPLRREVSNENPMFIYNLYSDATPAQLESVYNGIPEDIRPYFVIQIKPGDSLNDTPKNRTFLESMLAKAEALQIDVVIQAETMNTDSTIPEAYYADLFDRYSVLIGLVHAELSASNLTIFPIGDKQFDNIKETVQTVASKGGFFIWQDMSYEIEHIFLNAGAREDIVSLFRENKDNIILMDKHNGRSKRFVGPAAAMGYWTSDIIGNWGVNSEDWLWWEAGFGKLYEPSSGRNRSENDWKTVFSFPDVQFGMDWLLDMAGGATTYSLECPYHGFTSMEGDLTTPAFDNVIVPLIRKMVHNDIIPSKEAVMDKIQVAHHAQDAKPGELENDEYFRELYGPSESSLYEWMPSTGRYYYIPILPKLARASEISKFKSVTTTDNYEGLMPNKYDKVKRFNMIYPQIGEGDSWFVNFDKNWFIVNPNENANKTTTFKFPLNTMKEASLGGSISPHTLAIVEEASQNMMIHLNNYRIDSNKDVWNNAKFNSKDIAGYVRNQYIANPTDGELRLSTLKLSGVSSKEPTIQVEGEKYHEYTTSWNAENQEYTIDVRHNGPVDITIGFDNNGHGDLQRNLAVFANVKSSSRSDDVLYIDEKAIDGNKDTRWNASAKNTTGAWLELDFEQNTTVDKIVLKEFLNRVTGYTLQYWNGTNWSTIENGTTIGSERVHQFSPILTNKLRFVTTSTQKDYKGWGSEPSLYEFEAYNTKSATVVGNSQENLAHNKAVTVSSTSNSGSLGGDKVTDGDFNTSWNAKQSGGVGEWVEIDLGSPTVFNKVVTKAILDRITGYKIQYFENGVWKDIIIGQSIYPKKSDTFSPVMAQKVRIYITAVKKDQAGWGKDPMLNEVEIYNDQTVPGFLVDQAVTTGSIYTIEDCVTTGSAYTIKTDVTTDSVYTFEEDSFNDYVKLTTPNMTLSTYKVTDREKILINIENANNPSHEYDWIGLYEENETPDGSPGSIWYRYLNELGIKNGNGSFIFEPQSIDSDKIGRYTAGKRYKFILAYDDTYTIEKSASFTVEEPLVSFNAISDIHIKNTLSLDTSNLHFKNALKDLYAANPKSDALFIIGDLTDNASDKQYNQMNKILDDNKHPQTYFAMGNHDVRNLAGGYEEASTRFLAKTKMPAVYYETAIKGYHFLVLGTEQALSDKSYLSNTQLEWLESKLIEYSALNQPTFVFLHQPLYNTTPGTAESNGFGPNGFDGIVQDAELRNILTKYPQTYFISGHTHYTLGRPTTIYHEGNAKMVSSPSVVRLEDEEFWQSEGMTVNVFKDKVEVSGRDFNDGEWISSAHYIIENK
ncbi:MAG: glycosyl hydrolase family 98 C-terminal domain-containing protein [Cellulosilyticaceae bacterium]